FNMMLQLWSTSCKPRSSPYYAKRRGIERSHVAPRSCRPPSASTTKVNADQNAPSDTAPPSSGSWELQEERGVRFVTGNAFYRAESCAGRDLAVLAAALQRRRTGRLRVLDVMAGSGMRGARYLTQADADEVWVNDFSPQLHDALVFNMCTAAGLPLHDTPEGSSSTGSRDSAVILPQQAPTQQARRKSVAGLAAPEPEAAAPQQAGLQHGARTKPSLAAQTQAPAAPAGRKLLRPASGAAQVQEPAAPPGEGAEAGAAADAEADVRRYAMAAEGRAQQLKLEGLSKDVWQWELPRKERRVDRGRGSAMLRPLGGKRNSSRGGAGATIDQDAGSGNSIRGNLRSAAPGTGGAHRIGTDDSSQGLGDSSDDDDSPAAGVQRIRVSHADANRLLTNCYMREAYYDLIDVDSFGSETMHFPAAIDAVRYGGLLYLTSTDGFTSAGKRPERSLAAYGSYLRAMPWANEQGLRMVIGGAVREAASRGVCLRPVFSLYSYHGPVFRVMLRATRTAEWPAEHYGFVGHCFTHGDNYTVGWRDLGGAVCRCEIRGKRQHPCAAHTDDTNYTPPPPASPPLPLTLSGPMWTGPLHDAAELKAIAGEATARGWAGFGLDEHGTPHLRNRVKSSRTTRPLEQLLEVLLEEADPRLPPGFFSIDLSVSRRLQRPPPRDPLIAALRAEGFAAARCHLEARAFRTNACMADVLRVAEERLGIPRRLGGRPTAPAAAAEPTK
ncbi:hypothetical protein Agub_g2038, partial [Astrephomene gubernaculifera]